jgi:hypothetical protein
MHPQAQNVFQKLQRTVGTLGTVCQVNRSAANRVAVVMAGDFTHHEDEPLLIKASEKGISAAFEGIAPLLFEPMYRLDLRAGVAVHMDYVFALLNSRISQFCMQQLCAASGPMPNGPGIHDVRKMPFKNIDVRVKKEVMLHDEIVKNADLFLKLNEELKNTTSSTKTNLLNSQISYHQKRINHLVATLYGLPESEWPVVGI